LAGQLRKGRNGKLTLPAGLAVTVAPVGNRGAFLATTSSERDLVESGVLVSLWSEEEFDRPPCLTFTFDLPAPGANRWLAHDF
jgi:hypothetical protein